jgi:ABC-type transporter Mla subunit MlaD
MAASPGYFKLGLFILAGLALLAGALIFLGAGKAFRPRIFLETYLDGTVQGVDIGSPVKFRGVQIGRVSRIDFCFNEYPPPDDNTRYDYVYLELQVDVNVFPGMFSSDLGPMLDRAVAQGLRVMIQPQGITGLNFLELDYVPQPDRSPPLKLWWKPRHYYIPSAPGTLTSMLDSVNRIMATFNDLDLGQTLQEAGVALRTFNTTLEKFGGDMDKMQVGKISDDLQKLIADVRAKVDKVPVEELSKDGEETMKSLTSVSKELQTLVNTLQTNPLLNTDAMGGIVEDARATAENFRALSENLRDYPSQLILGQPPKRSVFDPAKRKPKP